MRVRVPPAAPIEKERAQTLAYIVGIALGDGNLSCPNGRATRLRITCDTKYPKLANEIEYALHILFPTNRVSRGKKRTNENCFDISVYSNNLNHWMPWTTGRGSKAIQGARVPAWIRCNTEYTKVCLKGLIQTDGCIYNDRGYLMVNFTNNSYALAEDARDMFVQIGFKPSFMKVKLAIGYKYTARVARNSQLLLDTLKLYKA